MCKIEYYYLATKRKEILTHATNLENILNKISQAYRTNIA
jgi:hypothetical protein